MQTQLDFTHPRHSLWIANTTKAIWCLKNGSLLLSGVLFGLTPASDVKIVAEENGVHDGLWDEGNDEPHHGLHPVGGDDRLISNTCDSKLGIIIGGGRCERGSGLGHLRCNVEGNLQHFPKLWEQSEAENCTSTDSFKNQHVSVQKGRWKDAPRRWLPKKGDRMNLALNVNATVLVLHIERPWQLLHITESTNWNQCHTISAITGIGSILAEGILPLKRNRKKLTWHQQKRSDVEGTRGMYSPLGASVHCIKGIRR